MSENFKVGYIYGIFSNSLNKCYIGSTWETPEKRFARHKSDFKRWTKGSYGYCSSFNIIEKSDDYFVDTLDRLILYGEKNTMRKQLRTAEQEWIQFFDEMVTNSIKHPATSLKSNCYTSSADREEFRNSHVRQDLMIGSLIGEVYNSGSN